MSHLPSVIPYTLPLSHGAFEAALAAAHGRALLHVQEFGCKGVDDALTDACIYSRVFDRQGEGSRAPWLAELIDASEAHFRLLERILARTGVFSENCLAWDLLQQCELALIFAKRGHEGARHTLYRMAHVLPDGELTGSDQIIELDGLRGLVFLARRLGQWLDENPHLHVTADPCRAFDYRFHEGAALAVLQKVADNDPSIQRYLHHMANQGRDKTLVGAHRDELRDPQGLSVTAMVDRIDKHGARARAVAWGRRASEADIYQFARLVVAESNVERLRRLLGAFMFRDFPFFDCRLLQLCEHSDRRIRGSVMRILGRMPHPEVRRFALAGLSQGNSERLRLLVGNYEAGDWTRLKQTIQLPEEKNEHHWALTDVLNVFEHRDGDECAEAMLLVYEHCPCTNCRGHAVRKLRDMSRVPTWVEAECAQDGDEEIRALFHGPEPEEDSDSDLQRPRDA